MPSLKVTGSLRLNPKRSTMNESFNPQVAAEKACETYRKSALQFEDLALNTPVS